MEEFSCKNCGRNSIIHASECYKCIRRDSGKSEKPSYWIPEENDVVNHPNHYKTKSGLEAINVIEAFTSDLMGIEATDTGNIIKYICRWKKKNGLEDLKKAQWYLNHLINYVEKESKS